MKTLANASDKQEIIVRLGSVRADSNRQWGKMTAHQMVCHLDDAFRLYMGLLSAASPGFPYPSRLLKLASLWIPIRWPRGFNTVPEVDQLKSGTAPVGFEHDITELRTLLDRFTRRPQDFAWPTHPFLGQMSEREWMRLGYLHTDHHFRQFGA